MSKRAIYLLGGDIDNLARVAIATKEPLSTQRIRKVSREDLGHLLATAETLASNPTTANLQRWQARRLQLKATAEKWDAGARSMMTSDLASIGKF